MIVLVDKSFEKDTRKIKDKNLLHKIADTIENVQQSKAIREIKGLKKLTGHRVEFRIKIGEYRLGIIAEGNTIVFVRCLHRKEIYKYFPK